MKKIIFLIIFLIKNISFGALEDYTLQDKLQKENIKILQELKVNTIDPILLTDIYSKRIFKYLYNTLFKIDEHGNIIPDIAKEYKYLDKKNLYIKLKENIIFQDKTFLSSTDVKNSLMRVKNKGALKEFYKNIKNIKILNNSELIIELTTEDKYLLNILSHNMSSIIKEKNNDILGTGDYFIENFKKNTLILKNKKTSNRIIITKVFSKKDRILDLYNNNADIIYDINSLDIEKYIKLGLINKKDFNITSDNIITSALIFNENRDLNFRKAINSLLNKKEKFLLPKEIYGTNFDILEDKTHVKNIKKDLNLKNNSLNLMILNTEEDKLYAKNIEKDLKKYGINVKIIPYQVDAFYYNLKNRNFDMAIQHIVFNKKYPEISLGKVILYDIYDKNLYSDLNFYRKKFNNKNDLENKKEIFIETVNEISKKLPYIPLKHQVLYILSNKNINI